MDDHLVTTEQEVASPTAHKPHVLLLGAGASRAALPNGDKYGRQVPLLREVADDLGLVALFPDHLRKLAVDDFEAAYSRLFETGQRSVIDHVDSLVRGYFEELELPDEPNMYDVMNLSLRRKDVIATFNWDPFLIQSRVRLAALGAAKNVPTLLFLHGNVTTGFCEKDSVSGLVGQTCKQCGSPFRPSRLLYPVEHKDYQSDAFIWREWQGIRSFLADCLMFTVFGYSAPETDKEAVGLLKDGWGDTARRQMEQTEVISRPGADHGELAESWDPFIHTHHYDVLDSFYDSFIAKHPRRSIEAYWNQYWEAKFIADNPVPQSFASFKEMILWFQPLFDAERSSGADS